MNGSSLDFDSLAQGAEDLREMCHAMVAGLVADGFTDREARIIVTGLFASREQKEAE